MSVSTYWSANGRRPGSDHSGYAVASVIALTPLDGVIISIIVLLLILSFIIWRRRNRRKNKGSSVYLFH
ncbi:MAG: hypothetical protein M1422_07200 [Candidatus Thermoplasmatota archaeon]|nr:hypothetical protein [Candidatus Sysuiplasma jiujiangense]MBX8638918.1 hypothetical protein [Candidatus Sysuiplasma jiujiangense]MBX8641021.1 hypothetical protein [Candidatus Sysuiplasma jiujiangense]MCL4318040.1 hypothetical protein [Candidatus Thermoplasmatota archaeon]MCL5253499.1 hypothetical protein [Candidatus Thermoplasmatota archaeon]